jgi:OmpA-OmpF porin, OOP family
MSKIGTLACILGLLASPFLCRGCHKGSIETGLNQKATESLSKAGLNGYKISFNGTDAILKGPQEGIEKAKTIVSSVCPFFYTIKTASESNTAPSLLPTPATVVAAGSAVADFGLSQLSPDQYELTGVYPSDTAKAAALQAAYEAYGKDKVVDKATVEAGAADMSYLWPTLGTLKSVSGLTFRREGGELVLQGTVVSEQIKSEIDGAIRKTLPEAVTLRNALEIKSEPAVVAKAAKEATPAPLANVVKQVSPDTFTVEVLFDTNSAVIKSVSKPGLNKLATALKAQSKSVEVQGHTDNQGSAAINTPLSQRRADAVRRYLLQQGVAADSLTAKGYGATQPRADNSSDEGRRQNRRIDFKIQ